MSAPRPEHWRQARQMYELGTPIWRIADHFSDLDGLGTKQIEHAAKTRGWTRPSANPKTEDPMSQTPVLSPEGWEVVRQDYITSNLNCVELGKKHQLIPQTINYHCKRENWDLARAQWQAEQARQAELVVAEAAQAEPALTEPLGCGLDADTTPSQSALPLSVPQAELAEDVPRVPGWVGDPQDTRIGTPYDRDGDLENPDDLVVPEEPAPTTRSWVGDHAATCALLQDTADEDTADEDTSDEDSQDDTTEDDGDDWDGEEEALWAPPNPDPALAAFRLADLVKEASLKPHNAAALWWEVCARSALLATLAEELAQLPPPNAVATILDAVKSTVPTLNPFTLRRLEEVLTPDSKSVRTWDGLIDGDDGVPF